MKRSSVISEGEYFKPVQWNIAGFAFIVTILLFGLSAKANNPIQDSTVNIIDSLKYELRKDLPDSVRVDVLDLLGNRFMYINPTQTIFYINEGLKILDVHPDDLRRVKLLNSLGIAYYVLGDFSKVFFYRFRALRIAERINARNEQANIFTNIGGALVSIKQYDKADRYFKMALSIRLKNNLHKNLSIIYTNLGATAALRGQDQQCIDYSLMAIEAEKSYNPLSKINYTVPYNNIGDIYERRGELSKAKYYYQKALEMATNMENVLNCYEHMGNLNMKESHFDEALTCFLAAEKIADENQIRTQQLSLYSSMADAYFKLERYKEASLYRDKYAKLSDSVLNERVTKQMNEMQARYESQKKDEEIKSLSKDKELIGMRAERKQSIRNLFIAVITSLLLLSIVIFRNIVLRQRVKNKILSEEIIKVELVNKQAEKDLTKLLHENTEAKYEVLKSRTNPHFLFNSLNTLSSVVLKDPPLAAEYLGHFSALYRRILNTSDRKLVSLDEELQVVNNYLRLQKMRFKENLIVDSKIEVNTLQYFVPPFAVQLTVENALKHNIITRLRPLTVNIYASGNEIIITNNLQKRNTYTLSTSTGQENIRGRYHLLTGAEITIIETAEKYIVKLPLISFYEFSKVENQIKDNI